MANKTTNYGLTKPLPEEFYDVNVQNANMDIIDAKMKELEEKVPELDITPESIGAATKAEVQTAQATANEAKSLAGSKAPMYTYGTDDLEAGVSQLETGKLYFVYE